MKANIALYKLEKQGFNWVSDEYLDQVTAISTFLEEVNRYGGIEKVDVNDYKMYKLKDNVIVLIPTQNPWMNSYVVTKLQPKINPYSKDGFMRKMTLDEIKNTLTNDYFYAEDSLNS